MVPRILQRINRSKTLKRALDVAIAGTGLAALSPVVVATTVLVALKHGWPPVFVQKRPGKDEEIFSMYKFRTMTNERNEAGELKPDAERLTPFGRWLRASSLDELPELINVLKGDMSLVGPRPLLVEYLPRYSRTQRRRHDVAPGITGLAQVRGRNSLGWEQKFEFDVQYVKEWSNCRDLEILIATIKTVLRKDGVQHKDHATMHKFMGTKE